MKYILKRWQDRWDQQIYNKLHEIHSLVGKTPCSCGQNRKEQPGRRVPPSKPEN